MSIGLEEVGNIAPLGELVTPEEIEEASALDGFGETVTPEEIEEASALDGFGQLTPGETGQVKRMKRKARGLRWNPMARLQVLRRISAIKGRARKRERGVVRTARRKAKIAATPEIALGPVSKAAAEGLPVAAIKRTAEAKAAEQKTRKQRVLRRLQTNITEATAKASEAKVRGQRDKAAMLATRAKRLKKAASKLAAAKIRAELIVRKAIERQRVVRAMVGGAPAIARYGARRFAEGKTVAGGVFKKTMTREFQGPSRLQ